MLGIINTGMGLLHMSIHPQMALVFTPKNYRHAFLLGPASDDRDHEKQIMTMIDCLIDGMSSNPGDTTYREDLEQICKWIIRTMRQWKAWHSLPESEER